MIKTERKEHVYYTDVAISGKCDNCGADIVEKEDGLYDYFRMITQHSDWGNDSCDTVEANEFCCYDCLMKAIEKYWKSEYPYREDSREMRIVHLSTLDVY